jgi:pimeloyl-ACP methyl ester carboxylesterase
MQHLVLLHGAIGAKDQLEPLAEWLKDKYIVHTLNFSGHGGSAFPDEKFSISFFSKNVIDYLRRLNIQKANIFGYSMGGYVAMYIAKHYPEIADKIITLATKFYWDEAIAEKEVKMLDPEKINEKIPVFAKQLEQRHHPNDWKKILGKTKEMLLQLGIRNELQIDDYTTIHNSCLLLLGDKDKMITLDETIAVCDALPNAGYKVLPATPHPIEQVDTRLLSHLITEFIN